MTAAFGYRRLLLVSAGVLYPLVFAALVVFERPSYGIGRFFYVAVSLVALATGPLAGAVAEGRSSGASLRVVATTLDEEWEAAGRPPVSFVKIDAEGAEEGVVVGARDLLREERPVVLAEVKDERVLALLRGLRYDDVRPQGFARGNVLFVPRRV